jgi:hypothetical protein
MVNRPVILVLAATQLEGVIGNNTTRNLCIIIYTSYFLSYQHTHIVIVCFFNANSFLPAMVTMRAAI